MLKFDATITSANGIESPFSISIEIGEHGLEGDMVWEMDRLGVKSVQYQDDNSFYCMLFWMGVYTRTWVVASKDQGDYTLSIRIVGNPFDYALSADGYKDFKHFVKRLNLDNPFPRVREDPKEFDTLMEQSELGRKSICLYEGSNIYKNLAVAFTGCAVNGTPVSVAFPQRLPQDLGTFISLGYFPSGEIVQIQWTFDVRDVPSRATLAIGAFRNGSLRDRATLQSYELKPFQSYKGSAALAV